MPSGHWEPAGSCPPGTVLAHGAAAIYTYIYIWYVPNYIPNWPSLGIDDDYIFFLSLVTSCSRLYCLVPSCLSSVMAQLIAVSGTLFSFKRL